MVKNRTTYSILVLLGVVYDSGTRLISKIKMFSFFYLLYSEEALSYCLFFALATIQNTTNLMQFGALYRIYKG